MRFIGIRDTYMEAGAVEELMEMHGFSTADIVRAAAELVRAKSGAQRASPAAPRRSGPTRPSRKTGKKRS
jgi:lipid A disaccharide synthetase